MTLLTSQATPKLTTIVSLIAMIIFLPLMLLATREVVTLLTRASGKPANIVVDAKAVLEPIKTDFYHAYAQGGEEHGDMIAPVVEDIKAIRPRLIRLDHIYDLYDVVGGSPSSLTFNWTALDKAVDTILQTGAKPMLALSYMPSVIAKDGVIINPPNDWNQWAEVVQKTIEHYSGRSQKNLSGIYYEVWNEPDLAQFGSWKYSGEKNYITLYHYASVGAQNAQNVHPFSLGGPATTGLYKSWIMALIGSGNRIDFLSWHTYQRDPKRFDQDQRNIVSWLVPYPGFTLVPKIISEYGFTGEKHVGYGTMYGAAHTAAVIRQLITGGPTWAFSFQPKDGPGQESGNGWGFITHESNGKRKKPRYFLFNFLDIMAGNRLGLTGEGTWVTGYASTKDNVLRLLLINFDTQGTHTENVPVTIDNLEPGTYSFRQRFFQGQDVTLTETVSEQSITKQIFMPASSILLIEVTKQ